MGLLLCAQALPRTLMWKEPPKRMGAFPTVCKSESQYFHLSYQSCSLLMLAAQAISQSESDALRAIT